jgi:hypothetical protein
LELLEAVSTGLFCQLITIRSANHRILAQSATMPAMVKLLPALVISEQDCEWIETL